MKIIPNAISVATIDERYVFSNFLSREAAYQLMISVWKEALPMCDIDVTTSSAQLVRIEAKQENAASSCDTTSESKLSADSSVIGKVANPSACKLQVVQQYRKTSNSGISEIDDESSSAISGSEGLTKLLQSQNSLSANETGLNNQSNPNNSSCSSNSNSNSNPSNSDFLMSNELNSDADVLKCPNEGIKSLTSTPKTEGSEAKLKFETSTISFLNFRIPRTIHIAYFVLSLVIILALLAGFLYYRITEMKNNQLIRMFSIDDLSTVIFFFSFLTNFR